MADRGRRRTRQACWAVSAVLHGGLVALGAATVAGRERAEPEESVIAIVVRPRAPHAPRAPRATETRVDELALAPPADPRVAVIARVEDEVVDAGLEDVALAQRLAQEELAVELAPAGGGEPPRGRGIAFGAGRVPGAARRSSSGAGSARAGDGGAGLGGEGTGVGAASEGGTAAGAPPGTGSPGADGGGRASRALLASHEPVYPAMSRRLGEEGRVGCLLTVRADGAVLEVEVVESSGHPRLDRAAREALLRWRFTPADATSRVRHDVVFRLR